jgi:hypothetical protein
MPEMAADQLGKLLDVWSRHLVERVAVENLVRDPVELAQAFQQVGPSVHDRLEHNPERGVSGSDF